MIVTIVPSEIPQPEMRFARTPGVHVSGIIRAIATEMGLLTPEWVEELSLVEVAGSSDLWWARLDDVAKLRISIGLAWEQFYIPLLPHVVDHPGEFCVEGIYMSPDGTSLDVIVTDRGERGLVAVHEIKFTYKSINTVGDFLQQWMWVAQTQAYCRALSTTRVYVHVLYACGDYSWPMRPVLGPNLTAPSIYRIDYTQEEIDKTWELLTDYRDKHAAATKEVIL